MWVLHSALPVPLVSMALAPLLPSISRILDRGPCHGPSLCILCTTLPSAPLAAMPCHASSSALPSRDSIVACGFVELPTQDLVSGSHATSSPSPTLRPRLKASIVTVSSSSAMSGMPQTMCDVVHLLVSYWPHGSYSSTANPNPRESLSKASQSL